MSRKQKNQPPVETIIGMTGDQTPKVSLPVLDSLQRESQALREPARCGRCRFWEQRLETPEHGECHLQPYPLAIPVGSLLQATFVPGIFLVMREAQWCSHFEPLTAQPNQ